MIEPSTDPATMQHYIKIVGNGRKTARDMTWDEAAAAMTLLLEGEVSPVQLGAFLAALRVKEECGDELGAFAATLRRYCRSVVVDRPHLLDLCLPYDGRSKAPSLMIAAVCVAAAGGAAIGLHGRIGQITPPKFGLGVGDILAALGIVVDLPLPVVADHVADPSLGLGFVSVAQFAPVLEGFTPIRAEYGLRSFFNSIEKILNPFGAQTALAGVFHIHVLQRLSIALAGQGYKRGLAVHGPEGSLDVLPSRLTKIVEFGPDHPTFQTWSIDPVAYFSERSTHDMTGTEQQAINATQNAELTRAILRQGGGADLETHRRGTLLTAALLLYSAGCGADMPAALELAKEALASGAAQARLEGWQRAGQPTRTFPVHTLSEISVGV